MDIVLHSRRPKPLLECLEFVVIAHFHCILLWFEYSHILPIMSDAKKKKKQIRRIFFFCTSRKKNFLRDYFFFRNKQTNNNFFFFLFTWDRWSSSYPVRTGASSEEAPGYEHSAPSSTGDAGGHNTVDTKKNFPQVHPCRYLVECDCLCKTFALFFYYYLI